MYTLYNKGIQRKNNSNDDINNEKNDNDNNDYVMTVPDDPSHYLKLGWLMVN